MKNSKESSFRQYHKKADKNSATNTPRFPSLDIKNNESQPPPSTPKRYNHILQLPEQFRFSFQRTNNRAKTVNSVKEQIKQIEKSSKKGNSWLLDHTKVQQTNDNKSVRSVQSLKERLASRSAGKNGLSLRKKIQSNSSASLYRLFDKNTSQQTGIPEPAKDRLTNTKVAFFRSLPKNGAGTQTSKSIKSLMHRPKPIIKFRGVVGSNSKIDSLSKAINE